MNLGDLASFICGKVNQSEAEDLAACKGFLLRRRDMIWDGQLWKDSLFEYTQAISASGYASNSTWLPTKKILLLPTRVVRVLAARTAVRKLLVESSERFYRTDFDSFASQGDAYQFRVLPACVWEFDSGLGKSVGLQWTAGPGPQESYVIDYLDTDLVSVVRLPGSVSGQLGQQIVASTERIEAFTCVAGSDVLQVIDNAGAIVVARVAVGSTAAPKRQRVQIIGAVPDPTTVRVLVKVSAPTFTADADEPGLTGVENTLIAYVQGDMLQRERQYSKSQLCYQEGAGLLDQLKAQETVQQAYNKRIIPEDGYGNPWDLWSHPPLSF